MGRHADRNPRWSVSRAAVLVTGLTAFSVILGFGRDIVIAAVFGAGAGLDAYLVAQGLMNVVLALIADAMARSVTPVTARQAAEETGKCQGHRSFNVALTVTMVILGLIAVLAGIFTGPVTAVIAPGFGPEQTAITEHLMRIVLLATVFIAGTNLIASLVQAHGRFAWSALEGVPFNIVMIAAAGLFGPVYGIEALAWGFVIGSALRLSFQIPPLRTLGTKLRPSFDLKDPGFREIARLAPPMLVGTALTNVNTMVDRAVASSLDEGSITALSYGWRLVHLPETLLIASLLVPLYPALSASAKNAPELRRLVGRGLSVTVTVLTPICVVLAVGAVSVVDLAFGYGAFDDAQVAVTATALLWYTPALLALGCRQIIVRASYAVGDSRSPVTIAIIAMVINVVGDIVLGPLMGVAGIALATTFSFIFAAVGNGWLLYRRHHGLEPGMLRGLVVRAVLLAAIATVGALALQTFVVDLPAFVILATITAGVFAIYLLGLLFMRAPERTVVTEMIGAMRRKKRG